MTYQPVYGIVSDEHCSRNTSSRWGKVHRIDFSGLTHFGAGIKVSLISEGKLPRKDIEEAKTKIVKWAEQGKHKRMDSWVEKLKERRIYNEQQEKLERVDIDIEISKNDKMNYTINGVKITNKILTLIKNNEEFLNKLEITNNLENEK